MGAFLSCGTLLLGLEGSGVGRGDWGGRGRGLVLPLLPGWGGEGDLKPIPHPLPLRLNLVPTPGLVPG